MFIDSSELIEVIVYYKKVGRHYVAYNETELEKQKLSEEDKKKFQKVVFKMKPLTWGLYNELEEASYTTDVNGERTWSYRQLKESRLKKLIVAWDAKKLNTKGELEPVPFNNDMLMSLSPEIAENVLQTYNKLSIMDTDEEKK